MTPEFAQPVNRIFDAVLDLVDRIEQRERPDLNGEKATIRSDLNSLLTTTGGNGVRSQEEMELVQRALIYWVDEILTDAHLEWRNMTLEVDYFGERNRAWQFYKYGEQHARLNSSDVIETWYLCLVLGFKGDIEEAFRDHLHLPLPGGTNEPDAARKAWAGEFSRLIRKQTMPEMTGEPISGGVEPLMGGNWLQTMSICLGLAVFVLIILAPIYYWHKNN